MPDVASLKIIAHRSMRRTSSSHILHPDLAAKPRPEHALRWWYPRTLLPGAPPNPSRNRSGECRLLHCHPGLPLALLTTDKPPSAPPGMRNERVSCRLWCEVSGPHLKCAAT